MTRADSIKTLSASDSLIQPEPTRRPSMKGAASFVALALSLTSTGCVRDLYVPRPCTRADKSGCVVDELVVLNAPGVAPDDVRTKIATAETSRSLGGVLEKVPILSLWDRATVDYETLDRFVLERDLTRIERLYRARGYYEAHARAGRVIKDPDGHVRIEIDVDQGPLVLVANAELTWKDWTPKVSPALTQEIEDARRTIGKDIAFDEEKLAAAKKRMIRAMADFGYAYGDVDTKADVDLVTHRAKVRFELELGPPCKVGKVTLEGIGELPEDRLRLKLGLREGQTFSAARIEEAEINFASLGVFGSVDVKPELSPKDKPRETNVPIHVIVQLAKLRRFRAGVGVEVGSHVEAHGILGWENKNLLGGLRSFSVDARPGFVLYPTRIDTLFSQRITNVLPEAKLRAILRQPGTFEARTDWLLSAAVNIYHPETATSYLNTGGYVAKEFAPGKNVYVPAVDNIIGYREYAAQTGLERAWTRKRQVLTGIYYNAQLDNPFSYNQDAAPDGYRRVLILYPEVKATFDFRFGKDGKPSPLFPHYGAFSQIDTQLAFGGDTGDFRVRPELRFYVPVSRTITLAARFAGGLLVPFNYGTSLETTAPCSAATDPAAKLACDQIAARDQQLLQFRAFFSGGPSSNRGYPFNGVGPHDKVTFLAPNANQGDIIATGGLTLWESSLELRIPFGSAGMVVFVDGSDVTRQVARLRLTAPHLSTGLGFRYDTPVGPFRADVGYRIPCLQVIGECGDVPADEGTPSTVFGLPIAISLAIGEAF
jgi:outer membrane protein insertion porin family/translocation and assembly module TamA